jgi:hypothetical protein
MMEFVTTVRSMTVENVSLLMTALPSVRTENNVCLGSFVRLHLVNTLLPMMRPKLLYHRPVLNTPVDPCLKIL